VAVLTNGEKGAVIGTAIVRSLFGVDAKWRV
jgi:hypothetical protein